MHLSTRVFWVSSLVILQDESRKGNKENEGNGKSKDFKKSTRSRNSAGEEEKVKSKGKEERRKSRRGYFARLPLLLIGARKCSCAAVEEEEEKNRMWTTEKS